MATFKNTAVKSWRNCCEKLTWWNMECWFHGEADSFVHQTSWTLLRILHLVNPSIWNVALIRLVARIQIYKTICTQQRMWMFWPFVFLSNCIYCILIRSDIFGFGLSCILYFYMHLGCASVSFVTNDHHCMLGTFLYFVFDRLFCIQTFVF